MISSPGPRIPASNSHLPSSSETGLHSLAGSSSSTQYNLPSGRLTKTPESSGTSSSGCGPGGIIARSHVPDHSSERRVRVDDGVRREGLFRGHGS